MPRPRLIARIGRMATERLRPSQKLRWTRAGVWYMAVWLALMAVGLHLQINLIMLVAGLAAGPVVASFVVSSGMLRRLTVSRRVPAFAFAGDPLALEYALENGRRSTAALAVVVEDQLIPVERATPGAEQLTPSVDFARVPPQVKDRRRWIASAPGRGRYQFGNIDLVTHSPFGLMERRETVTLPGELIVYPKIGTLARRWHNLYRQSTETRRGRRHDRSAQQQEYHGLRDYRPGDSPRWIHWRTSARVGVPMVKEFEHQDEQEMAILLDPWLPRNRATDEQRAAVEDAIRFAATVCVESCRHTGRRLLLGWTGPTPGVRQGPASIKLLHELLTQLAIVKPSAEGQIFALFDALPPPTLRSAVVVLVSTRSINLFEEADRSTRLAGATGRGLAGRALVLNAARGDLTDLVQYDARSAVALAARMRTQGDGPPSALPRRPSSGADGHAAASMGGHRDDAENGVAP